MCLAGAGEQDRGVMGVTGSLDRGFPGHRWVPG